MKAFSVFLFAVLLSSLLCVGAAAGGGDISPALDILRGELTLTKTGVVGSEVTFTEADFETLYGSEVSFITVSSLPDGQVGRLALNGVDVIEGQTIAAASLSYLRFVPASDAAGEATFTFKSRASGWEDTNVTCVIALSEKQNLAPIVSDLNLTTVEGAVSGSLPITEPDGDACTTSVETYPTSGRLSLEDDGTLLYTPLEGFRGTDSFTYHVTDAVGNRSATATVTVSVEKNDSGIVFSDMETDEYLSAALEMSEKEIMTYKLTGDRYTFEPTAEVSKADFVVMLMTALGYEVDLNRSDAVFADLDRLSAGRRAYLAEAADAGIVPARHAL
ncbi:MAG: Ig-like domain-containing protein [Acutalibacteraceae bacterium]